MAAAAAEEAGKAPTEPRTGRKTSAGSPVRRKRRRWPWIVFPILGLLLIVAVTGGIFVLQALTVRDNLQEAKGQISQVVPLVKAGDTEGVQKVADEVLALTTESNDIVGNPLWQLAGAVPFVGENVSAVGQTTMATHVLVRDAMHDQPVDGAVVVYGDVAKSHGFFETEGQIHRQHTRLGKDVEGLPHGVWRRCVHARDQVRADVHTQLHGPAEVE